MENRFYIDILKDYKSSFKSHIDISDNYRTIFSGIFGIGKTTFLKDFFELSDINQEYEVIHLFPVNYSIASNEDIFELIKFDIFYRLLSKNIEFDIENVNIDISAYQFIFDNFNEIIFPFLNFIPEVGGSIKEVAEKCIELKNKFQNYHNDLQSNELDALKKFLNEFTKKKGTIYENDFYTELIVSLIDKLKKNGKRVILIVDDLDRIDPDHIFRLLNVFSAHTDIEGNNQTNQNKFDLDKIVFVCDVENIRNIYKAKFGVETDFNGYIDKFYSKSIFQFNIFNILNNSKKYIIANLKFSYAIHGVAALTYENDFSQNFLFVLEHLFLNNKITLRDLSKIFATQKEIGIYNLRKIGYSNYYNTTFILIQLYDVFLAIFSDDKSKLLGAFQDIKQFIYKNDSLKYFLADILLVMFLIKNANTISNFNSPIEDQINKFKIRVYKPSSHFKELECEILNYEEIKNDFNYFKLLQDMFETLANRN